MSACFGNSGHLWLDQGPIDPFYWLKVLLKTRSKSTSMEPLIDLLKLWVKNPVFGLIQNFSEKA